MIVNIKFIQPEIVKLANKEGELNIRVVCSELTRSTDLLGKMETYTKITMNN